MDFDVLLQDFPEHNKDYSKRLRETETSDDFNIYLEMDGFVQNAHIRLPLLEDALKDQNMKETDVKQEDRDRIMCVFCQLLHEVPDKPEYVPLIASYFRILGGCNEITRRRFFSLGFYRTVTKTLLNSLRSRKSEESNPPDFAFEPLLRDVAESLRTTILARTVDVLSYYTRSLSTLAAFPGNDTVGGLAFLALKNIVGTYANDPREICSYVFMQVLPALLMTQSTPNPQNLSKSYTKIRDNAVTFVQDSAKKFPSILIPQPAQERTDVLRRRRPQRRQQPVGEPPDESGVREANPDEDAMDVDAEGPNNISANEAASSGNRNGEENDEQADADGKKDGAVNIVDDDEDEVQRPEILDPYLGLIEFICLKTPDRADYRTESQITVLRLLTPSVLCRFCSFIKDLSRCEVSSRRTVACDMACAIVESNPSTGLIQDIRASQGLNNNSVNNNAHPPLRDGDMMEVDEPQNGEKQPGGEPPNGNNENQNNIVEDVNMDDPETSPAWDLFHIVRDRINDVVPNVRCKAISGLGNGLLHLPKLLLDRALDENSKNYVDIPQIFRILIQDPKPMVRKAALVFFDQMRTINEKIADKETLDIIISSTSDISVLVRKGALQSFALMMREPKVSNIVFEAWSKAVLPCIADPEATVGDRACDLITVEIFDPIGKLATKAYDRNQRLYKLVQTFDSEGIEFLQRALTMTIKKGTLKPQALIKGLETILRNCRDADPGEWPIEMWPFIEEMCAKYPEYMDATLVMDLWNRIASPNISSENASSSSQIVCRTLKILSYVAPRLPAGDQLQLLRLETWIATFSAPPSVINDVMRVLASLRKQKKDDWTFLIRRMVEPLMVMCQGHRLPPTLGPRILFTLGEIALAEESAITHDVVTALKTIVSGAVILHEDGEDKGKKITLRKQERAHGLIALGKLCLRREELAKNFIEVFVHHLRDEEHAIVRVNALVILSDLAVAYTSLVDRFVPLMSDCLRDENLLLRKQAAMTLSSLLAEEYIKFKGPIVFRLLYGLSDPFDEVRFFIEAVFSRILIPRNQKLINNVFAGAICAFNEYTGISAYQGAKTNEQFSLWKHPARRAMVYKFMLGKMNTDQKFTVSGTIVTKILTPFTEIDDPLPVPKSWDEPLASVIEDCLALLSCSELKVCFRKTRGGGDDDNADDNGDDEFKKQENAVMALLKKNVCDHVVPVLLTLKERLVQAKSSLLLTLNTSLREVIKDFTDDLSEVIPDAQQVKELMYDIKIEDQRNPEKAHSGRKTITKLLTGIRRPVEQVDLMTEATPIANTPRPEHNVASIDDTGHIRNNDEDVPKVRFSAGASSMVSSRLTAATVPSCFRRTLSLGGEGGEPVPQDSLNARRRSFIATAGTAAQPRTNNTSPQGSAGAGIREDDDDMISEVAPRRLSFTPGQKTPGSKTTAGGCTTSTASSSRRHLIEAKTEDEDLDDLDADISRENDSMTDINRNGSRKSNKKGNDDDVVDGDDDNNYGKNKKKKNTNLIAQVKEELSVPTRKSPCRGGRRSRKVSTVSSTVSNEEDGIVGECPMLLAPPVAVKDEV